MWIEVNSPHSNRPVRVRDKDVGRSVRDEEGRIFFVLPRSTGDGYYGSVTRTGGPREEQKYLDMIAKEEASKATGEAITQKQVHDATGRKRSTWKGRLVIFILLAIVLLLVYLFTIGPWGGGNYPWRKPATPGDAPKQGDAPKAAADTTRDIVSR